MDHTPPRQAFCAGFLTITSWLVPQLAICSLVELPRAQSTVEVTFHNKRASYPGLNTQILERGATPKASLAASLFDMSGAVVQTWRSANLYWYVNELVKPLPTGNILTVARLFSTDRKVLVELDSASRVRWVFDPEAHGLRPHHDFQRLANDHTLVLTQIMRVAPAVRQTPVLDDVVVEVNAAGQYVWAWSTANNFATLPYTAAERAYLRASTSVALFHTNSLQSLPRNRWENSDPRFSAGNLLLSQRDTNTIFIIEKTTGNTVWSHRDFIGQHHPRMIPRGLPGAGNILVLDNGGSSGLPPGEFRPWSRVVELDPVTLREVWVYECRGRFSCSGGEKMRKTFFTEFQGGAQRLVNGNTLITEATEGRVFEVTKAGAVVWEYVIANRSEVYRCYRSPINWPAGQTVQFHW